MNGAAVDVVFAPESLSTCWDEALPLMRDNYEETGTHLGEFKPDLGKLQQMEHFGFVRIFTARSHGKLIGYQVFFVMYGINTPSALMATCHVAFVDKAHRGFTSLRFLKWADRQLMLEGATSITRQSTVAHPLDALYSRMGYKPIETSWLMVNPFAIDIKHGGLADGA